MTGDRCTHRPGGCPLCDPRPLPVDRDLGCVCPPGRRDLPLHADSWQPSPGCPVHVDAAPLPVDLDPADVVVELDDLTRQVVAGLWGEDFVGELEATATAHARAWLAEQTPGPGAPPDAARRPGEEGGMQGGSSPAARAGSTPEAG